MAVGGSRIRVREILVVEGRYDRQALSEVVDAVIVTTDGFRIFRDPSLKAMLQKLARELGVIALTDSDGGGLRIRTYLQSILPPESLRHVYIPPTKGVERRKHTPGKAGLLGVEAMPPELLRQLLEPFAADIPPRKPITKAELYALGLSGGEGSATRRAALCRRLRLPEYLSASKLGEILGILYDADDLETLCRRIEPGEP